MAKLSFRVCLTGVLLVWLEALTGTSVARASPCPLQQLTGEWRSVGYNTLLAISADRIVQFNVTAISRIAVAKMSPAQFADRFDRLSCHEADRLTLFERGGNTPYDFIPVSAKDASTPPITLADPLASERDARSNFAVFSQYFKENYAFFRAGDVDVNWSELSAKLAGGLREDSSESDLLTALQSAIGALRDAHVRVTDSSGTRIATSLPLEEHRMLMGYLHESGSGVQTLSRATLATRFGERARDYSRSQAGVRARERLRGQLVSGWLEHEIGYIAVHSFAELAAEGSTAESDRSAMHSAMLEVLHELSGARGIVIDLRFNGGGYDPVALEFVGFFTATPRPAYTKKAYFDGREVTHVPIHLTPSTQTPYIGPLAVLVSDSTASGAEIALLALRQLPRRTFVGQASRGVLSDTLPSKLPNGWSVSLSNEIYVTPNGTLYERVGIPVDVDVPVMVEGSWQRGLEASVRAAVGAIERPVL